ncbi:MAG: dihydrodipicolinate synthase family protein [Bacillota bacterium]|nr:dihydrodipicolinate synthase family protein [Bacillota bacterium]
MQFKGIIPAIVLPMTEDARIDEPALRRYVGWLLEQDCHGLAINVDTGEGPHLWPEERIRVIQIVRDVVRGRVPVVAGLAASFTEQAVRAAKEAERAGADGLLVFPIPVYRGRPLPAEIPYRYHKAIAEAVSIPLILFQLQDALGGVEFELDAMTRIFEIPRVVAIKEAAFDARKFLEVVRHLRGLPRDISILTGNDNFIAESFVLGADGALIGFGTLATEMQVRMYEAWSRGERDTALEIGRKVQALADVIFAQPVRDYRVRTKEALVMQGVIPRATVREPLLGISDEEREKVRGALARAGLV